MNGSRAIRGLLALALASGAAVPAMAQSAPPAGATAATEAAATAPATTAPAVPKLIVAISVDQFSADLFAGYRQLFTGGLRRLADGVVFPSGYQAHAATETCPGHSTILTGVLPDRNGVVANNYFNLDAPRADKKVYCAEDESQPLVDGKYAPSVVHLKVPSLGDRMKAANPATRVVSVAGKDRAAIMMAGHKADQVWWLSPATGLASYRGVASPEPVARAASAIQRAMGETRAPLPLPAQCAGRDLAISTGEGRSVGQGRFARGPNDSRAFAASPEADGAVLAAGAALRAAYRLGEGAQTDLLILGLSATDYVGHGYGTEGAEMCAQMLWLDRQIGDLMTQLDTTGIDYVVMLTADHGGHDLPERLRQNAIPEARRVDPALSPDRKTGVPAALNAAIATATGQSGALVFADSAFGDYYLARSLTGAVRTRAVKAAADWLKRWDRDVAQVFTRDQIMAVPVPTASPELWTPIERVRASYDPARSGDLYVVLRPRITPIPEPDVGYVATHGSAWDYDRRVPILFWRKGMAGFEQPNPVKVVDVAPTLSALIGLSAEAGAFDGRCLDLWSGPADSCAR